jgi:hypothetical protein
MGIFNETMGDNDFASIFDSVAEERKLAQEKAHADTLLKILDEMDNSKIRKDTQAPLVEYLRVDGNGDIVDKDDKEKRRKIMTVDELPKESEYEMLFGKPAETEPQVKVETGRRLHDGKTFQKITLPGFEEFNFDLTGIRFETLVLILSSCFFIFMVVLKLIKLFRGRNNINIIPKHQIPIYTQNMYTPEPQFKSHEKTTKLNEFEMENEIERRVQQRLLARIQAVKSVTN